MTLRWRSCFGTCGPRPLCPKWSLPRRLGTRAEVVQALEQGALYALPPWAETCRVVNAYGALLNLDVRPLLRRIYAQLEAGIVELAAETDARRADDDAARDPQDYSFPPSNAGGAAGAQPARHSLAAAGPADAAAASKPAARDAPAHRRRPQAPRQNAQPQAAKRRRAPSRSRNASRSLGPAASSDRRPAAAESAAAAPQAQPPPQAARPAAAAASQPQPQHRHSRSRKRRPVPQPLPQRPALPPEPPPLDADRRAGCARADDRAGKAETPPSGLAQMGLWRAGDLDAWHSGCGWRSAHAPGRRAPNRRATRHGSIRRSAEPQGGPAAQPSVS